MIMRFSNSLWQNIYKCYQFEMGGTLKRPTLRDVARLAGLSPAAVSLILNDKPDTRLSEDARRRVIAAVEALGYRPNVAARSLVTSKSQTIALITDHVATTRFGSGIVKGCLRAADKHDQVIFLLETDGDERRLKEAVATVLDRGVDGIVFSTVRARQMTVPPTPTQVGVVMLNATSELHTSAVLPDEFIGGSDAMRLLLAGGHGDGIALIGLNDEVERDLGRSVTIPERLRGLRETLFASGHSFLEAIDTPLWEPEDGYAATKGLLDKHRRGDVTAIVCLNDRLAFGCYQALSELGLRIPDDISIVSFDNDELAAHLRPGLTTIELPYEEMAASAIDLLFSENRSEQIMVPMRVIERGSVSPLNA
jgi:LacI family transcriptional regulator